MHIEQLEIAALTNCPHAANDTRAIRHHQKVVWPASPRPELFWRLVAEPAFERGCVVLVVRNAHLGDGTTEHFHCRFRVCIQSRSNMCCRTLRVGTGGLARRSLSSLVRPFTQDTLNESPALDLFERGIHLAIITRPPGNIQFDRLVFSSPSFPLDSPHGKSPLRIQFAVVLPYTELFRFFKLRQYAGLTPLFLIPNSPNKRSTRNHPTLLLGDLRYSGKLLQT